MTTDSIISKVWSFCHTLRDDGAGYGDYLEQLTYRIFLKMVDEVTWTTLDADTKGNIYEGNFERNAEDTKSGAGAGSATPSWSPATRRASTSSG